MEKLTELLANRKWRKRCLRTNIAAPEDIQVSGKVRVALVASNNVRKDKEPVLYEAIREAAPEWWDDVKITVNKDVVAQRHRDGNAGHSWLLWLGDFTGDPHVGTKYSIILYRSDREPKSRILHGNKKHPSA